MSEINITTSTTGVYHVSNISAESARHATALLSQNHDSFNIFWNHRNYHNHQVHYLLTAYALGATPKQLQVVFDGNTAYQRPMLPIDESLISKLSSTRYFKSLIPYDTGDTWFNDFRTFFERQMQTKSWQAVVNEYLFSRSEIAEELLVGLFAGVIHPLIHFGFGIEFEQPAVIAESLAMATTHNKYLAKFLHGTEKLAKFARPSSASLLELSREILDDPSLFDVDYWDGGDSLNETILADAPEKLCDIASRWTVSAENLDEKTAEMINFCSFMTGAAQRPDKLIKLDFFFIHCANASIFFSILKDATWLTAENKARFLEWKGRTDLLAYASRCAPKLYPEEITEYQPKQPGLTWSTLISQVNELTHDDGHIAKLVRALAHGELVCKPYEDQPHLKERFPLRGSSWLKIANMALDTTGDMKVFDRWVRGAGADKNWQKIPPRK